MNNPLIKKHILLIVFFFGTFLFFSCNNPNVKPAPTAHGLAGDIVVVMQNESWNSEFGDNLRAIFEQDCPAVPMEEPLFDLHQIPKEKFKDQNLYHRNVIFLEINPNIEKPKISIIKDKYAKKQIFVNIAVKDLPDYIELLEKNKDAIIKIFLEADRDRWVETIQTHYNKTISKKLRDKYNISVKIPKNYQLYEYRDTFAWMGHEARDYTMNIIFYSWTLTDSSSYSPEYLIAMRNLVLKDNVPGQLPGTYMTTETKYDYPIVEVINHNYLETAIMRGLWKVHGDFMGGPFVAYYKKDIPRKRMVCMEGFVFYPNNEVRDKIRLLENSLYTFDLLK
jgi:hypothetical protein